MATPGELLAALRRFGLENDRLDAAVARRIGAAPAEFKAMDHLHEAGQLTPSQLGDRLCLSSGAVTALVDRLERLGWARREPHPSDRRSVVVRTALPGQESAAVTIYSDLKRDIERAARRLNPGERAAMVAFLDDAGRAAAARADAVRTEAGGVSRRE